MIATPVRYSPDVETVDADESDAIDGINQTFDKILQTTSTDYGHAVRSVHAKAHAILEGTLLIAPNLPPELSQGMFARPGEHKVVMRFSTNAGDILPDAVSLPRGLALKVLDVDGERLPDAEGRTQNFVLVNGPIFQAKTAKQFLGNLKLLAGTTDRAEGAKVALSSVLRGVNKALHAVGVQSPTVNALGGAPNAEPLGETYYSVTPFRYGDYIAKFSVVPVAPELTTLTGQEIDASDHPNAIREQMQREMRNTDAVWEFRVQLCRDLEKQPIEDSTVKWSEEKAPFHTVATLRASAQDSWSDANVRAVDDGMRFSVWVGLKAHLPLGNINRARKAPYERSAAYREKFNRCPIHEPSVAVGE